MLFKPQNVNICASSIVKVFGKNFKVRLTFSQNCPEANLKMVFLVQFVLRKQKPRPKSGVIVC